VATTPALAEYIVILAAFMLTSKAQFSHQRKIYLDTFSAGATVASVADDDRAKGRNQMQPEFKLARWLKGVSFTDCFGKLHAETPNLIVTKVTLTTGVGIAPYYRYVCEELSGRGYQEGAGRFFAPMLCDRCGASKCICRTPDFEHYFVLAKGRGLQQRPECNGVEHLEAKQMLALWT